MVGGLEVAGMERKASREQAYLNLPRRGRSDKLLSGLAATLPRSPLMR